MLFKNDIFTLNGRRLRLLHVDSGKQRAWVVEMDSEKLNTFVVAWSLVSTLAADASPLGSMEMSQHNATAAMLKVRNRALLCLGNLLEQIPAIFESKTRSRLVEAQARAASCSTPSLYKYIRLYLQGGQTSAALIGRFHRCGRLEKGISGGRGAKSKYGVPKYELTEKDHVNFKNAIETNYLRDSRVSISNTYERMLGERYSMIDGNEDSVLDAPGNYPTRRQFTYFLSRNYPLQTRLRKRVGDKDFERDHRAVLGTVLADCEGVGHYYEADATIVDVFLVASHDVQKIVGKPTLYLIKDRKSRLIVGWYVGLENASWVCAMQAILCISQDKKKICQRLGVNYHPEDWPAHEIYPREILSDRSEMFGKESNSLPDELGITVTTVPSQRGDLKAVIESDFKQQRMTLQDGTPGFDPPENAKKRQGKHYEKDACLTLFDFEKQILLGILKHNRSPMRGYDLSLKELGDGITPDPVSIWNHNIATRAGALVKYTEERVRFALLSRGEATVTEHGIEFNGCYYSGLTAVQDGWFVAGRQKRFGVEVFYDRRLVDEIYVKPLGGKRAPEPCRLTARSVQYTGLSVVEVMALQHLRRLVNVSSEQVRLQALHDYQDSVTVIHKKARQKLAAAGKKTRSARRADTKSARTDELRSERQELLGSKPISPPKNSSVVPMPLPSRKVVETATTCGDNQQANDANSALSRLKQRMIHG